MIHHAHKCIFIHIPKTGGTSIETSLTGIDWYFVNKGIEKHCTLDELERFPYMGKDAGKQAGKIYPKYRFHAPDERKEVQAASRRLFPPEALESYFKFTFVRNPFEWVVSTFFWSDALKKKYKEDFNFFVQKHLAENRNHFHSDSQYRYTLHKGSPVMNFIGKFENFAQDFSTVMRNLGLPDGTKPLHLNKNKSRPQVKYQEIYDKKSLDIVYNKYKLDFKKFNYEYGE